MLWEEHYIKYRMEKPKLIVYVSERLPEAARNDSVTELELCGLAINIASFFTLIKKGRFQYNSRSFSFDSYH